MKAETLTPMAELDCGCKFDVVEGTFILEPCNSKCVVLEVALDEIARQDKTFSYVYV